MLHAFLLKLLMWRHSHIWQKRTNTWECKTYMAQNPVDMDLKNNKTMFWEQKAVWKTWQQQQYHIHGNRLYFFPQTKRSTVCLTREKWADSLKLNKNGAVGDKTSADWLSWRAGPQGASGPGGGASNCRLCLAQRAVQPLGGFSPERDIWPRGLHKGGALAWDGPALTTVTMNVVISTICVWVSVASQLTISPYIPYLPNKHVHFGIFQI